MFSALLNWGERKRGKGSECDGWNPKLNSSMGTDASLFLLLNSGLESYSQEIGYLVNVKQIHQA